MILGFNDDALSGPLPELGLGRPKLFGVTTDYESCMLPPLSLFFLFLLFAQVIASPLINLIGLTDSYCYCFRVFSAVGYRRLARNPERGCFVTPYTCAVLKD